MTTENRKMIKNIQDDVETKMHKIQSDMLTAEEVKKVYVNFSILV